MPETNRVLLMSTGGQIAGQVALDRRTIDEARGPEFFADLLRPTFSFLKKVWNVDVEVTTMGIANVDSSDIKPETWMKLANTIKEQYDKYDSFIITHGTNTMGYTCSALTFSLPNLNKPVVLTGSQVPSGEPGTDALTNLSNALRVAVCPYDPRVKGVVAVFGSEIITGARVRKETEFDYDAFKSFGAASLGHIGRIINLNPANLTKHLFYLGIGAGVHGYAPALTANMLICEPQFDMRIASLTEFPGMNPGVFEALANHSDIQGFILRSYGAGDPSNTLRGAFEYLKVRQIPVVVTTQAPNGNANFQVNDPGRYLKDNELAIPSYDMSIESLSTKLAWLLSKKTGKAIDEDGKLIDRKPEGWERIDYHTLCEEMVIDMHGEVNPIFEIR